MEKLLEEINLQNMKIWEFASLLKKLQAKTIGNFEMIHKIKAHQGIVRKILFCRLPSKLFLISCGNDKIIKIWDMKDFSLYKTLEGHKSIIYKILIFTSNKHQYLCSSSNDRTIKIWSLSNFKLVKTLIGHTSTPFTFLYIGDQNLLVSGDWDGHLIFWNIRQGSILMNINTEANEIWSLHYDKKKRQILIGSRSNDKLLFYNIFTKKLDQELQLSAFTQPNFVKLIFEIDYLKFHPDSNDYLVCSGSNNIAIINKDNLMEEALILKGHTNQIRSFVYCKKLNCLISVSCDRSIRIWKIEFHPENKKIEVMNQKNYESPHTDNLNCVIVDEEERLMSTCSWDGCVIIYKF